MNFSNLKILVVGDVMLDEYISGTSSRISPEAPVPVVNKHNSWNVPGGAANVACGLKHLGCQPVLIGLVGNDNAGKALCRQLEAIKVEADLAVSPSRPTTTKTRILSQGQQLLRLDEESTQRLTHEEYERLSAAVADKIRDAQAIILSDYAKGVLLRPSFGESLAQLIIQMATSLGSPVLVDPKMPDWSRYAGATCITPNTKEFLAVCHTLGHGAPGRDAPTREERHLWAEALCEHFNFGHLLLTRGKKGMTLYTPDKNPEYIKATMREVADVSGAGDTVIATLAAAIAGGYSWPEAAKIANTAAGIAVTKIGASPVALSELRQALDNHAAKLSSWPQLKEKLRLWRDDGQRIVFTNGCFDILHPGHIAMLRQSAALGDRLIVGLNTDASVKRLKGPERPIQNEESRATLLSALEFVDAVILFPEDTPQNLIHNIRPDVLVKGNDYRVEDIAGARFVQDYGGQVCLIPLVEGFSTTDIARRIQGHGISG